MARPIKNTVDYFPHIIQNGKTIFILENKFGNDGYAFWFKLLELLGSSNNHVYDYNNLADWEFLLAKTKVSEEKATEILKTLADVGAIDRELLGEKMIWCENFIKNIEVVYKNRRQETPHKPVSTHRNPPTVIVSTGNNPHSIVEDTIVDNSKEIKEVQNAISRSLGEKPKKSKIEAIEYDQEIQSWHGIIDSDIESWERRYPNVNVGEQLMKIREYFKNNPGSAKDIEERFKGRFGIYIDKWLERAEGYKAADSLNKNLMEG